MSGADPGRWLAARHSVEYGAVRGLLAVVDRLSTGAASGLARALGRIWWTLDHGRRRIVIGNLLRSGIASDAAEARRIGRASSQHFAQVLVESLKSESIFGDVTAGESPAGETSVVERIAPDVRSVLEEPGRGLIMVSGHFGNWEIAAHSLSRYKPVAGITRPMNNPRVEELVQQRKGRFDFRPIPKYSADPRHLLRVLADGEVLALLCDQHAHRNPVQVPFFGHDAATHPTPAMLHLATRTPLCFASCRRVGPMRFELETSGLIELPRTGDKKADVRAILVLLNEHLEECIRRDPSQYLWAHRRWRSHS